MSDPAPNSRGRAAIVLVNWNGWRESIECIDSVLAQDHANFHIFVVDNDSGDDSIGRMVAWCRKPEASSNWRKLPGVARHTDRPSCGALPYRVFDRAELPCPAAEANCHVTFIRSGGNLGFAGGCNVGIRAAGLDNFAYFWFLNCDTVVDRRALVELIARAERQPRMGIVGSTLLFYDKPDTIHALAGARLNRRNGTSAHIGEHSSFSKAVIRESAVESELAFVCGASMLTSTRYIRDVGMMDEDYFLYYEDVDWAMRGSGRFQLGFASQSLVYHKSGANSSKVVLTFAARYFYRNRLRFVGRFLPDRMAAAKRKLFEEMLRHLARGRWGLARVVASTLLAARQV
jgi:GT2 family glycosyltransferase